MSFYNRKAVVAVPASKVAEFNKYLERNGYGANFLVPTKEKEVIGAADDAKTKAATHYVLECGCDAGLAAALKAALKLCNDKLPKTDEGVCKEGLKGVSDDAKIKKIDVIAEAGKKLKEEKAKV